LVKVPRVIAMMVLLRLARRIRSCDGSRVETAMGAAITASVLAAGARRRTCKAGKFAAQRPRGGRLAGRGNFFGAQVESGARGL
jgi:hypothetical protein